MSTQKIGSLVVLLMLIAGCGAPEGGGEAPVAEPAQDSSRAPVALERAPAPADALAYFVVPSDGDTVTNPVTVQFGLEGMQVAAAGTFEEGSGHHHLLIDTGMPPLDQPIPKDEKHLHFGDGQTETTVELSPGEHTLLLVLGDGNHVPHDPPVVSKLITITVEP